MTLMLQSTTMKEIYHFGK